jgi:hypothetical protein
LNQGHQIFHVGVINLYEREPSIEGRGIMSRDRLEGKHHAKKYKAMGSHGLSMGSSQKSQWIHSLPKISML